jgi:hypothetical protein
LKMNFATEPAVIVHGRSLSREDLDTMLRGVEIAAQSSGFNK